MQLKKINKNIKVGTKIKLKDHQVDRWFVVTKIHETRRWLKIDGIMGSFQTGHIAKYTNKKE